MPSRLIRYVNGWPQFVNIGDLWHSVQIQQETITGAFDASGTAVTTWTTIATVQAAIATSGAGVKGPYDVQRGGQVVSQLFTEVAFYFAACPTLKPNDRVITDTGNIFIIAAAENVDELNYIWVLSCIGLGPNL